MAALSEYPQGGSAIVRGDPLTIPVDIKVDGVPIDVSGYDWRAQIRTAIDGSLVTEFATSTTTPAGGSVASTVVLDLTPDQTELLTEGMVFDLEQRDGSTLETIRTWWICTKMRVQKDVSNDALTTATATAVRKLSARG
jgi:hypothetical protein